MNGKLLTLLVCFYTFRTLDGSSFEDPSFSYDAINTLQRDIRDLKFGAIHLERDITEMEEKKIEEIEICLFRIESEINDQSITDDVKRTIIFNQHYLDLIKFKEDIDNICEKSQVRKQNRLTGESIEAMKSKNLTSAVKTLLLISNLNVDLVVRKAYNDDKANFDIIRNVAEEIPSIALSLKFYKSLKRVAEDNNHVDEKLALSLIESIMTNVLHQVSADRMTKSEGEAVVENLESSVKRTIVKQLENFIDEGVLNNELEKVLCKVTEVIKRYKFFRGISESAIRNVYTSVGYNKVLTSINSIKLTIPKIILLNALYMEIIERGETAETIFELVTVQKSIQIAYSKSEGFEKIWPPATDVSILLKRQLKRAILNGYYLENEIRNLTTNSFKADDNMLLNVMRRVVKEVYNQTTPRDMLKMFSQSSIGPSVLGFISVYEAMKENGDLKPIHFYTLVFMFKFVEKTFESTNHLKGVSFEIVRQFNNINVGLLKNTIVVGGITLEEFKKMHRIEGNFEQSIQILTKHITHGFNPKTLLDAVRTDRDFNLKLSILFDLHNNMAPSSHYLFEIAELYKKLEFELRYIDQRTDLEKNKLKLPPSVKRAVFGSEVYIKNVKRGGEYLCLVKNLNGLFTYVPGGRGNESKWVFESSGGIGIYKIKNLELNEYLFASEPFDAESRRVRSSSMGNFNKDLGDWLLIPTDEGIFIKSRIYQEYLFTGHHPKGVHRHVFTLRNSSEVSEAKWAIEEFFTTY